MITSTTYNRAFWNAMRGNREAFTEIREGSLNDGAYILPNEFRSNFTAALEKENIFRRYSTVLSTSPSESVIEAVASTGTAAWVGEGVAIPESSDRFTTLRLNAYKLAALSRIKQSFIQDTMFNVEKYLTNEFARRFGRAEEDAFIIGDGETRPSGILHETQGAQVGVTAASETALTFDEVKALYFALNPEFRRNAIWIMNDQTAFHLRTLKDISGASLWNDNSGTILNRPVEISPFMPDIAAGTKPIVFADLQYYWITERQPLAVKILSEKYILQGHIGLAAHEVLDGRLIMPEAAQVLKMA